MVQSSFKDNIYYEKTQRERISGDITKQKLIMGSRNVSGTTTNMKPVYGTVYSVYRFRFKRGSKVYLTDRFVGTATTHKNQTVQNNYPDLFRGAYLNAVYQFRAIYNVGSKGFTALHERTVVHHYQQTDVRGTQITDNLVMKYNPEEVSQYKTKKELMKGIEEKERKAYIPETKQQKNKRETEFYNKAKTVSRRQKHNKAGGNKHGVSKRIRKKGNNRVIKKK
jgi:hypothetical protein